MTLFDTHAHLDAEPFDGDREAIIAALHQNDVRLCLVPGTDMRASAGVLALAAAHPGVLLAAVGVHPHEACALTEEDQAHLEAWLRADAVALGEVGLDYHYDFHPREVQRECLLAQTRAAARAGAPVIYHVREAFGEFLDLLRAGELPLGVMHCYSGSVESARECLDRGMYISFSGSVTFKNAHRLREVAAYVPDDRLLCETDCPYLAPEPMRGRRNEPAYVAYVARMLAQVRAADAEALSLRMFENACKFFRVDERGGRVQD